jgi:hypothetical protein
MAAMTWPTPTVCGNYNKKGLSKKSGDGLATMVAKWPTPTTKGYGHAAEGMVSNLMQKIEQGVITKLEAEQMLNLPNLENHRTWKKKWPTPTRQDADKATKIWREDYQNNLTAAVFNPERIFPTPTARDHKGGYKTESLIRRDGKSRAFDHLPNAVLDGKGTETSGGQLNPTWVEWLMGWPLGWTDLKPLETGRFRSWQQQHGGS